MPSSLLFGINNEGRVFGLSTNGTKWREFVYYGLEFKHLSAVPHSLWAVGGDRQIYLHVHGLDIPIRIKEECFENERWTPVHGFSSRLLPTDRYNFSSQDGTKDKSKKKIRLPSMAWQWEGDWHLDLTLNGQPLDHDGWTYAVDFPATYYPSKQWTSCVRRRKWIRYRRYSALNSWCAIATLHKDPTHEPFIDVSAGGQDAGFPGARLSVWAVTAHGRLMFRTEVSATSPEGQRWSLVTVPYSNEVHQVTVGATGLVWVVMQNGSCLVRTGITRDCILGTGWSEVAPPDGVLLNQVSMGNRALWAVARSEQVWFRSGINPQSAGTNTEAAIGVAWVKMIGNMASVSVTSNDQVFAVGSSDKSIYFRTSVTPEDLTGKTWKQMGAPTQMSRTSSVTSLFSTGTVTPREKRHRSWTSLNRHSGSHETASRLQLDLDDICHSAPALTRPLQCTQYNAYGPSSFSSVGSSSSSGVPSSLPEEPDFRISEIQEAKPKDPEPNDVYEDNSHPVFPSFKEQRMKKGSRAWSPMRSCGSIVGVEAQSDVDSSIFDSETTVGVYGEVGEREEEDDHLYWKDSEAFWSSVEAGACLIHSTQLPNWFCDGLGAGKADLERPWRLKILQELKSRVPEDILKEQEYHVAVDASSWVKTANVKCQATSLWLDACLSLEWVKGENDMDCATLTISCSLVISAVMQFNIADLTAIMCCSEPGAPRISLHRGPEANPVKIQFSGEEELEDWLGELNELCTIVRKLAPTPSLNSLWLTTNLGDVYAFDITDLMKDQLTESQYETHYYVGGQKPPFEKPLCSGFPANSSIAIHGCVPEQAERFAVNLGCEAGDIAFHFNPRFDSDCVVRNAKRNGAWGPEDRRGGQPFTKGLSFIIVITSEENAFKVTVDGQFFTSFNMRGSQDGDTTLSSAHITHLGLTGDITITKVIYNTPNPIIDPSRMFFRHIGGHLKKVESAGGVTWGIGLDNTAWVYTGGTGGPYLKISENSKNEPMADGYTYFVYENQRWNPLTGYTSTGLPTDRHMWSDVTGRHRRTREKTKLLSRRWQWEGEWAVDYSTAGGTDKEGWQYAVDFPAKYHGSKHLTDYVRRRRWRRRARLTTSGPWTELGHTPLADCSLHVEESGEIVGWGVALNGDVLFRTGLSSSCPTGLAWEHIGCDEPLVNISGAPMQLWGVSLSGCALWRFGITPNNSIGSNWETVDAPQGVTLKMVSVGQAGVWVLDTTGRLSVRREISLSFPFGNGWLILPLDGPTTLQGDGDSVLPTTPVGHLPSTGFRHVLSSASSSLVYAVTTSGRLSYRLNVTPDLPSGTNWLNCLDADIYHCTGC